jgi:hypothetical protein
LKAINPSLRFLQEVDKRTGYRTKQMLVAPVVDAQTSELLGVVQIINNKAGFPFAPIALEGVKGSVRNPGDRVYPAQQAGAGGQDQVRFPGFGRRDFSPGTRIGDAHRASQELDIEEVLVNEFQVKHQALGVALGKFFNVPYEPFKGDRIKPADLLKNLKRDFLEQASGLRWKKPPKA